MLSFILSFLGGNLLSNLATASMAIVRGAVGIVVDLSGSREGRIVLAIAVAMCLLLYGRHYYIDQGRAGCPTCKLCTSKTIQPPSTILDWFNND